MASPDKPSALIFGASLSAFPPRPAHPIQVASTPSPAPSPPSSSPPTAPALSRSVRASCPRARLISPTAPPHRRQVLRRTPHHVCPFSPSPLATHPSTAISARSSRSSSSSPMSSIARPTSPFPVCDLPSRPISVSTTQAAVASAFVPPPGMAPYSYVFDLTGEVSHDRGEVVRRTSTCLHPYRSSHHIRLPSS